jgi:ribosomal protein S18 acetylase RimI-like enzyme
MDLTIREAKHSDREVVGDLFKEMFDFHGQRDSHFTRTESGHEIFSAWFVEQIDHEDSLPLVVEVGGKVVGYALGILRQHPSAYARRAYGEINDIAVSSDYRRRDAGLALFKKLQDWFISKKISRLEVKVAVTNEVSSAFWRKMDFKPYLETMVMDLSEQSNGGDP